ncbi:MarR family winged helix-turn-helix transcriptional regulator [Marinactinospora thermotolerans]|uniref:DNA-binding transcriptional regulator, MarR family n=1 Tax=Marinactinospora thermotolerans DSM 45154 TaxID=1122192 RepID=A0A1T4SFJ5_9ACTN|nr:MarR family transcriptional regulator [Marinactinospora thermotolerans]SKA26926.1 DNA-binding transcriptional regulator, MarR family [Marinactinospora thermotolerans DSM 45154]
MTEIGGGMPETTPGSKRDDAPVGPSELPEVYGAIEKGGRRLSVGLIRLLHSMAGQFGLNPTDMQCWSLLQVNGPMTPGRLAHLTGLTSGAITAVIDRLERSGYVRRERHPDDRRKIMVAIRKDHQPPAASLIGLRDAMVTMHSGYSDEELRVVSRWLEDVNGVLEELADRAQQIR